MRTLPLLGLGRPQNEPFVLLRDDGVAISGAGCTEDWITLLKKGLGVTRRK